MTNYLEMKDYLVFITAAAFQKLVRDNNTKILDSESMAYGYINEKLSSRYNVSKELSSTGSARNSSMVRWMSILSVYFLYQSIPDDEIPERIRTNYEDVLKEIDRVASGKDSCTLSVLVDADGKAKTKFKWYSREQRSHNPFE